MDVFSLVFNAMHTFPKNEDIQRHGCKALHKLFEKGIYILYILEKRVCWEGTANVYVTAINEFLHPKFHFVYYICSSNELAQNRFFKQYHKFSKLVQ